MEHPQLHLALHEMCLFTPCTRPVFCFSHVQDERLQVVAGDVTDTASLPGLLQGAKGVVFAASGKAGSLVWPQFGVTTSARAKNLNMGNMQAATLLRMFPALRQPLSHPTCRLAGLLVRKQRRPQSGSPSACLFHVLCLTVRMSLHHCKHAAGSPGMQAHPASARHLFCAFYSLIRRAWRQWQLQPRQPTWTGWSWCPLCLSLLRTGGAGGEQGKLGAASRV